MKQVLNKHAMLNWIRRHPLRAGVIAFVTTVLLMAALRTPFLFLVHAVHLVPIEGAATELYFTAYDRQRDMATTGDEIRFSFVVENPTEQPQSHLVVVDLIPASGTPIAVDQAYVRLLPHTKRELVESIHYQGSYASGTVRVTLPEQLRSIHFTLN